MKKKYGENHLRKEEKESSKKGMNKKKEYVRLRISIKLPKYIYDYFIEKQIPIKENAEYQLQYLYIDCITHMKD